MLARTGCRIPPYGQLSVWGDSLFYPTWLPLPVREGAILLPLIKIRDKKPSFLLILGP